MPAKTKSESTKKKQREETTKKSPKDAKISKKTTAQSGDREIKKKRSGAAKPSAKAVKFGPFNRSRLNNVHRFYVNEYVPSHYKGRVKIQVQRNVADVINSVAYPILRDILTAAKEFTVHGKRSTMTQTDVMLAFNVYRKASRNPLLDAPLSS
jgi:histone H3/H4